MFEELILFQCIAHVQGKEFQLMEVKEPSEEKMVDIKKFINSTKDFMLDIELETGVYNLLIEGVRKVAVKDGQVFTLGKEFRLVAHKRFE